MSKQTYKNQERSKEQGENAIPIRDVAFSLATFSGFVELRCDISFEFNSLMLCNDFLFLPS